MHPKMALDTGSRGAKLSILRKQWALIRFAVTAKLICAFVFACAKSRFSFAAQLSITLLPNLLHCGSFNAHK